NKRFECRTRRALCQHAVDLTIDRFTPVIRRPNPRFDGHVAWIQHQRCNVVNAAIAVLSQVPLDLTLHNTLKARIKSRVDAPIPDSAAKHRIHKMRRGVRQCEQMTRTSKDHRKSDLAEIGVIDGMARPPRVAESSSCGHNARLFNGTARTD